MKRQAQAILFAVVGSIAACSPESGSRATGPVQKGLPVVELEGTDLAREALKILGAPVVDAADPRCTGTDGSCATHRCSTCHSLTRAKLEHWARLTLTASAGWGCNLQIDPATLTPEQALEKVNCMRSNPSDPTSPFSARKLGVFDTGVQYEYFQQLFSKAFGETGQAAYDEFVSRVGMPKGNDPVPLSELEVATVLKWFLSGSLHVEDVLPDPPAPTSCHDTIDTEAMRAHLDRTATDNWSTTNRSRGILMHGCPPEAASALECLTDARDRTADWGNPNAPGPVTRELTKLSVRTGYWTRSSADGRFVGYGNGGGGDEDGEFDEGGGPSSGATITDLQRGIDIPVSAYYDPGFFPDNNGFIFQGEGTLACAQSVLETSDGTTVVTPETPGCTLLTGIGLYQHVGRALGGGDYLTVYGSFTSDDGDFTDDPFTGFDGGSAVEFVPMVFDGTTYQRKPEIVIGLPYEGDAALSPSTQMLVSRISGPEASSIGYAVRHVNLRRRGPGYSVSLDQDLARVCVPGGKAAVSLDDRFLAYHHYEAGTANVFVVDLLTGARQQITSVPAGVKALFPHFRSDGWVYFIVMDTDGAEYVAANDAAVRLAAP